MTVSVHDNWYLVVTPQKAKAAIEAEKEFGHRWFPEFEHQEIREIEADGIGEESWALRGGTDDSGFVEIGWRRANATLAVYVNCRPCDSVLADAARRWAHKIDDAAKTAADRRTPLLVAAAALWARQPWRACALSFSWPSGIHRDPMAEAPNRARNWRCTLRG